MNSILICCASVSAMLTSPGYLLAERIGAPVVNVSHGGKTLTQRMPTDAQIQDAAMVVMMDGLYWYNGFKPDCDDAERDLRHVFAVRGNRPMWLATIPWKHGCAERINPILEAECRDACILTHLEGDLAPPELHPDAAYFRKVADRMYNK